MIEKGREIVIENAKETEKGIEREKETVVDIIRHQGDKGAHREDNELRRDEVAAAAEVVVAVDREDLVHLLIDDHHVEMELAIDADDTVLAAAALDLRLIKHFNPFLITNFIQHK